MYTHYVLGLLGLETSAQVVGRTGNSPLSLPRCNVAHECHVANVANLLYCPHFPMFTSPRVFDTHL